MLFLLMELSDLSSSSSLDTWKGGLTSASARIVDTGNFEWSSCNAWKNSGTCSLVKELYLRRVYSPVLLASALCKRATVSRYTSQLYSTFYQHHNTWPSGIDVQPVPRPPLRLLQLPIEPILPLLFRYHSPHPLGRIDDIVNLFLHVWKWLDMFLNSVLPFYSYQLAMLQFNVEIDIL